VLSVPGLLAACAGDSTTAPRRAPAADFEPSAGHDIPKATVRFGMKPFASAAFYVIGMKRGYYDEVGITIEPKPFGLPITPDNQIQIIVNDKVDIVTMNGPSIVRSLAQVPDLRIIAFAETFVGMFVLAAPDSGVDPMEKRVKAGASPEEALRAVMQEIKGRPVGVNNSGTQRAFLNEVYEKRGGITFDDVDLTVTSDSKLVQLAKGGQIDFATPDGSQHVIELLRLGWYPVVSIADLATLPGSERFVAATLTHDGLATMLPYYEENTETCLRFISVMFRLIDEINGDMDSTLPDLVPYLEAQSGAQVSVEELKESLHEIDFLVPFDEQDQYWGNDKTDTRNFEVVYGEQIKAAQEGGILPEGRTFKPTDGILAKQIWDTFRELRASYDELEPQATDLTGEAAQLAEQAAQQYEWRNYLDAYRMLRDAVGT
jgi:ABC-type nitrate/sulfonate/bicarbonate transport system substrate-binding protein